MTPQAALGEREPLRHAELLETVRSAKKLAKGWWYGELKAPRRLEYTETAPEIGGFLQWLI
jgi:hypothetical protein